VAQAARWQFIMRVFLYRASERTERSVLLKYRSLCERARQRRFHYEVAARLGEGPLLSRASLVMD
jgi:hypothetical protein